MERLTRIRHLPASLSSLILLISAAAPLTSAEPSLTQDSSCGCYLTNGNQSAYFSDHRFFDFRSLSQHAGVPDVINDSASTAGADPTSAYFTSSDWSSFWMLGSWNNSNGARADASVLMINSPNNIYIESDNTTSSPSQPQTFLTLRTQRLDTFQTAAEIESASAKFKHLSIRMRARTVGAAGAITALFSYRHSATLANVQEADLEIRTSDPPGLVHYTNQPAYTDGGDVVPLATRNATLPGGRRWNVWATHRMDWTEGRTTWFVDDEMVAQIEFQAPRDESNVILNAWSDGGGWTGNMTRGEAAYLQVQWLEVLYNSTEEGAGKGKSKGGLCGAVCSVDQTTQLGKPVMLWNSGATMGSGPGRMGVWVPLVVGVVMMGFSAGMVA
ncbi:beta-glucanase [Staphylotrichum tortipilum]|uniref:Beta-glucanase n=1 Tax=Staphylotrichum tortipilum TaxID=2831512 RepID=A0AAN6RTG0_9PEZI|nr:beta-glucanase [Staphylotrichum longicolle]